MNYFEKELRTLFEKEYPSATFVGRKCLIPLGDVLMAEIFFDTNGYASHYSVMKVNIVNRKDGSSRHALVIKLLDLWGNILVSGCKREPYIWDDCAYGTKWYGFTPTAEQYSSLRSAVDRCISMYGDGPKKAGKKTEAFKLVLTCPNCGNSTWYLNQEDGSYECAACEEVCFTEDMSSNREEV